MLITTAVFTLLLQATPSVSLTQATACAVVTGRFMERFEAEAAKPDASADDHDNLRLLRDLRSASEAEARRLRDLASDAEIERTRAEVEALFVPILAGDVDGAELLLGECASAFGIS